MSPPAFSTKAAYYGRLRLLYADTVSHAWSLNLPQQQHVAWQLKPVQFTSSQAVKPSLLKPFTAQIGANCSGGWLD